MQRDISSPLKEALIEYVKSRNDNDGKIMEFINHIDEAAKVAQNLPIATQNDLAKIIISNLAANGIIALPLKNSPNGGNVKRIRGTRKAYTCPRILVAAVCV